MRRLLTMLCLLCLPLLAEKPAPAPVNLTCDERTQVLEAAVENLQAQIAALRKRLEGFQAHAQADALRGRIQQTSQAYRNLETKILKERGQEGCKITNLDGTIDCPDKPDAPPGEEGDP